MVSINDDLIGRIAAENSLSFRATEETIGDAADLFRLFHQKEPRKHFAIRCRWPQEWSVCDYALRTGYLSNKWNNRGKWIAYTHLHTEIGAPEPVILIPRKPSHRGSLDLWKRKIAPMPALAWLGYCLDIELSRPRGEEAFIDFKQMKKLPHLAGVPNKNYLVIMPQDQQGDDLMILWSPRLTITDHGIEN